MDALTWNDVTKFPPPVGIPVLFTNGKMLFAGTIEDKGIYTQYPDEDFEYYEFLKIHTEQLIMQRCITHWMQLPALPATPVETDHRILNNETLAAPVENNPGGSSTDKPGKLF